ncbi:MAG: tetraacyldisaccharide 4'-kinase [Deltaproteobacteria bacterium]|nr:tetraacyldisaccharide 4'-kinase [Deltaproteobacteria bacterium]MBW2052352.1 tetraacyldisaccharide 4'-kinase [Deltaproteobacteria bacterium]MBW2139797.1 tetraacyldisaccharide 4'-kinase [Deltaproteobacteria bacterium]MBW2322845.1 tetraacyldisaccharide 4'-kinase [Deltaproteobacteria bacterium]
MNLSIDLYSTRPGFFRRRLTSLYGAAVDLRLKLYNSGRLKSDHLKAWVISVGNLVVGGTGKTPAVIFIAGQLHAMGIKTAVLSRGYHGNAKESVNIVSDGKKILLSPFQAGDEAYLIAESLPGVAVLTGKDRHLAGQYAIDHFDVQTLILDDGFQHLKLKRDINLLLLDAKNPWGNGWILPAGPLREPRSQAARATAFMITRSEYNNRQLIEELEKDFPSRSIFPARHQPVSLTKLQGDAEKDLGFLVGTRVLAFCGLARPQVFLDTLTGLGVEVAGFVEWPDHFHARRSDLLSLAARARELGIKKAVTTAKDAVKLRTDDLRKWGIPLEVWVLGVEFEILERKDEFMAMIYPNQEAD